MRRNVSVRNNSNRRLVNARRVAAVGRSIRNRLPVELHRRIDRYANTTRRRIPYSFNHLNAIRRVRDAWRTYQDLSTALQSANSEIYNNRRRNMSRRR